ncbi:hypothetical protein Xfasm12_1436 [Xylella fastidiosa M12]|nr:hypothetical protein Xfasm12_1436 [Xylella fastidiosa M12]
MRQGNGFTNATASLFQYADPTQSHLQQHKRQGEKQPSVFLLSMISDTTNRYTNTRSSMQHHIKSTPKTPIKSIVSKYRPSFNALECITQ